jgi:hypothetical protein
LTELDALADAMTKPIQYKGGQNLTEKRLFKLEKNPQGKPFKGVLRKNGKNKKH